MGFWGKLGARTVCACAHVRGQHGGVDAQVCLCVYTCVSGCCVWKHSSAMSLWVRLLLCAWVCQHVSMVPIHVSVCVLCACACVGITNSWQPPGWAAGQEAGRIINGLRGREGVEGPAEKMN